MNQAQQLITEIERMGASIGLDIDCATLRIEAPRGALTDQIKNKLAEYKQDILRILKDKSAAPCQGCPYHDTGPTPDGSSVIHWCGPFKELNGDTRWWNIAEMQSCPLNKWGDVSQTVH